MEDSVVVKEILNALHLYSDRTDEKIEKSLQEQSEQFDKKLEQRFQVHSEQFDTKLEQVKTDLENQMNEGFKRVDTRLDNLDKKFTGMRVEMNETQETINYLSSKSAQHEEKLQNIYRT